MKELSDTRYILNTLFGLLYATKGGKRCGALSFCKPSNWGTEKFLDWSPTAGEHRCLDQNQACLFPLSMILLAYYAINIPTPRHLKQNLWGDLLNLLDFDSETFLKSRWSSACPLPPTPVHQTAFHFFLDSRRNHLETDLETPELTTLPLEAASRVACQVRSRKGEAEADWESIQQLQRAACNRPSPKPNCNLIQSHLLP